MDSPRSKVNVSMTYGAYYGLSAVVMMFLSYFLSADMKSSLPTILSYVLLALFMFLGTKSYRDHDLGGGISYGQCLSTGVLISIFGGIIVAVFSVVMFTLIDPSMTEKILEDARQRMFEQGTPDDQIEMAINMSRKFMSPIWLFLFGVLGSAFAGFLISLFVSIFVRKSTNPFTDQTI